MSDLLAVEALDKRFGQVVVASRLTFRVGAGETLGIIGPNGAGKSTLFSMIAGDLPPDHGMIRLDGHDITGIGPAARCRLGLGRTYQVPRPFEGMTVFENVLVAAFQGGRLRSSVGYARAASVLADTGLRKQANIPAGQLGLLARKRLEVARALATGPRLLLLDEVAGGLTDPEVEELVGIVRRVNAGGVAVVWIEHVVRALVSSVGRLVCLAGGTLIAEGEPRAVLADPRVREIYLGEPGVEPAAEAS